MQIGYRYIKEQNGMFPPPMMADSRMRARTALLPMSPIVNRDFQGEAPCMLQV